MMSDVDVRREPICLVVRQKCSPTPVTRLHRWRGKALATLGLGSIFRLPFITSQQFDMKLSPIQAFPVNDKLVPRRHMLYDISLEIVERDVKMISPVNSHTFAAQRHRSFTGREGPGEEA